MSSQDVTNEVMGREKVTELIQHLLDRGPVMAPKERPDQPGFHLFDWVDGPEEVVLDYVTTTMPPKKAFFRPVEPLFKFSGGEEPKDPPEVEPLRDESRFALFGVHPCDLAAIDSLDRAYSQPPADSRWALNRKRASIVVGVDCLPDEYCFCTSVETCRSRNLCDIFLTPIDNGDRYLAELLTPAGRKLADTLRLADASPDSNPDPDPDSNPDPDPEALRAAEQWREKKEQQMEAKLELSVADFADTLEAGGLTPVWQDVAERCYSCGSCNTTCPTCFCFNVYDHFDPSLTSGVRVRSWDSCQLADFALVAGGHNFRGERWQRVRHRWHRKFSYLYRNLGRPYCTGCGRCSRACTADINIVDVCNQLIEHARKEHARKE
jgi:formate hydrogenlyase subunit 6/NADH:ubiquinone oxidoreductase subunit I